MRKSATSPLTLTTFYESLGSRMIGHAYNLFGNLDELTMFFSRIIYSPIVPVLVPGHIEV